MIENLKTLIALSRFGTMSEAATHLRVSQSTVSKRIVSLEKYYNRKLIQKVGRRVELTPYGKQLAVKAPPILSGLRDLFTSDESNLGGELVVGVSEAVLSSWGPAAFAKVQEKIPEIHFVFHAHRTAVVLDRIRSGEFLLGVCAGSVSLDTDLQSEILCREPMVVIPSKEIALKWKKNNALNVITIEEHSSSWRSIKSDALRLNIHREVSLESFFSVAQMAIAGFGHGLVPIGVAQSLNVPKNCLINLGPVGLSRPVRFVARKSTYALPFVEKVYQLLLVVISEALEDTK